MDVLSLIKLHIRIEKQWSVKGSKNKKEVPTLLGYQIRSISVRQRAYNFFDSTNRIHPMT